MSRKHIIENKLSSLEPEYLEVLDQSNYHMNHYGTEQKNQQSHFVIKIAAKALAGKSRVMQHRMINDLLKEEFMHGLHALSIKVLDTK